MPPASPKPPKAQITVRRNSPDDIQLRQIIVKLDGKPVAELMYGGTVTFPVTPGRHRLRVDNTWNWKFLTISRAGRFTWFLVGTLGAGPMYVSLHPDA